MLTSASGGVALAYDPLLRLRQVAGAATTRFDYDGLDMIAEYNGSKRPGVNLIELPSGDTITQVVSVSAFTILNVTEYGHQYYPGVVELRATPLTGGTSMVTIAGVGDGPRAVENEIVGRLFFGTVATVVGVLCADGS